MLSPARSAGPNATSAESPSRSTSSSRDRGDRRRRLSPALDDADRRPVDSLGRGSRLHNTVEAQQRRRAEAILAEREEDPCGGDRIIAGEVRIGRSIREPRRRLSRRRRGRRRWTRRGWSRREGDEQHSHAGDSRDDDSAELGRHRMPALHDLAADSDDDVLLQEARDRFPASENAGLQGRALGDRRSARFEHRHDAGGPRRFIRLEPHRDGSAQFEDPPAHQFRQLVRSGPGDRSAELGGELRSRTRGARAPLEQRDGKGAQRLPIRRRPPAPTRARPPEPPRRRARRLRIRSGWASPPR